jgi:hypothetical protein
MKDPTPDFIKDLFGSFSDKSPFSDFEERVRKEPKSDIEKMNKLMKELNDVVNKIAEAGK